MDAIGAPIELVELGSGSALKTRHVIEAALARQKRLVYHPIDISSGATRRIRRRALIASYDRLKVIGYASDYFDVLENGQLRTAPDARILALFLGSNIGNYEPPRARVAAARAGSGALRPGDHLLLAAPI